VTHSAEQLATDFLRLSEYLTDGVGPDESRQRLVDLACRVVPGCRWAAITAWPLGRAPRTIAASSQLPEKVDTFQYEAGEGPCLSAADEGWTAWSPDLAEETRWPAFVARTLADSPVRGVLAMHLSGLPGRNALNLYADEPGAFTQQSVATGALFATHAGALMAHADAVEQAAGLQQALESNRRIGVAVGMLMSTYGLDQDTALKVLRRTSSQLNRKLRDVADEVACTGQLPEAGAPPVTSV